MGSSPLTRGKHPPGNQRVREPGLIPAHAGKTAGRRGRRSRRRAHPRSRGENLSCAPSSDGTAGSSPLTRGKPSRRDRAEYVLRLIPAHAGKTSLRRGAQYGRAAHPRSRGENATRFMGGPFGGGSSPLTRGKPEVVAALISVIGLIPAHAGKTATCLVSRLTIRAHPRSRGENGSLPDDGLELEGSSPLTRGKPWSPPSRRAGRGLIPAHAGKTRLGRLVYFLA